MKFILILLIFALIFALPIILLIKNKEKLNIKFVFVGLLMYLVFRILLYPFIGLFANNLTVLAKSIIDVIYLLVYILIVKRLIFTKVFHLSSEDKDKLFSSGLTESTIEVLLVFLPNLLNLGAYFFLLEFGNIYDALETSFTANQIQEYVTYLNSIGYDYFMFLGLMIIALYLFNITNNYLLVNNAKLSFVYSLVLYVTYFVLALLNKWIACIILIGLITSIYYINSKERI